MYYRHINLILCRLWIKGLCLRNSFNKIWALTYFLQENITKRIQASNPLNMRCSWMGLTFQIKYFLSLLSLNHLPYSGVWTAARNHGVFDSCNEKYRVFFRTETIWSSQALNQLCPLYLGGNPYSNNLLHLVVTAKRVGTNP